MTTDQLYAKIYLDEKTKFTSTQWGEDKYIKLHDAEIVDNEGNLFDISTSDVKVWTVWEEPQQNTTTLDNTEAFKALRGGKRVKATSWENKELQLKDGQVLFNDGTPFNIMTAKEKEWVVIEECKDSQSESQQIAELKAMLEKVLAINTVPSTGEEATEQGYVTVSDGRSTQAQSNTAEKLIEVYGVSTPKEIQAQFKEQLEAAHSTMDIQKTVSEYIPYCWIGDRTLGTTSVYYSNMRKLIKGLKNENYREVGLSLFVAPQSVYEVVQDKIVANKKEEIRNKNTFDLQHTKDTVTKIKHKILSDNFSDKPRQTDEDREKAYWAYSYLTIVTGRRQSEILKTLEIKRVKGVWQYCGITKDREDGKCIKAYSLDEDYEFLSDLLDYVQEHVNAKSYTVREMNSKYNHSFNNAMKKRVTGTSYKASDWRDIYAEMLWIAQGIEDGSNVDKRDFKAKVLGHKYDGKLSATEHYDGWEAT